MKKEKTEKEKVRYYDDGSTIAGMDNIYSLRGKKTSKDQNTYKPRATEKEKLHTFFTTMKMMIVPCIVALTILFLLYLIMMIIVSLK